MTTYLTGYDRAEAEYLSQPENRLTDADCSMCNTTPCVCDRLTDEYRDYLMERDL